MNSPRQLSFSEKNQTNGKVEAIDGKFRMKFAERASRGGPNPPKAGELLEIDGVVYIVEGPGKSWTSKKELVCYLYLTTDSVDAPEAVEAPEKAEPLATDKQVNYALMLGANNADFMYDAHPAGYTFTRAELAAMTRPEISELIDTIKAH